MEMLLHFLLGDLHLFLQFPGRHAQHTGAQGRDLHKRIRGGYAYVVIWADPGDQCFDIGVAGLVFFGEYRYAVKKIEDDTYTRWGYNTLLGFFKGDIPKYMVFSENAMLVCFIAGCGVLLKAIISYIMSFIL